MKQGKVTVINAADLAAFGSLRPNRHELSIEYVTEGELALFPGNARVGNVGEIAESIEQNGFFTPLIVQRSTGHIIVGNHRFMAAKQTGMTEFPVVYLDVDDDRAKRMNLVDNKLSDDADYDTEALLAQLTELPDLDGTGWTDDELAQLLGEDYGEDDEEEDLGAGKAEITVECPNCSHEFDPNKHRVTY